VAVARATDAHLAPGVGREYIATAWFANRMEVSEAKIVAFTNSADRGWLPASMR
jgi:hypothetical protein